MKILLILISFFISNATLAQTTYHVKTAGDNTSSGLSWNNAFASLRKVLSAATVAGDVIYVAQGTYYPDESPGQTNNDGNSSFVFHGNRISVYGGYKFVEWQYTQNRQLYPAVLSGYIQHDVQIPNLNAGNNRIDGFSHLIGALQSVLQNIYFGGGSDGFTQSFVVSQNPMPNIYKGGSDDGFTQSLIVNHNQMPEIYHGGSGDGFSYLSLINQNLIPNIYKGGSDDGFTQSSIISQNLIPNIYKGGSDDGFSHLITVNQNPLSNIYRGGNDDGFSQSSIVNQNAIPNIYTGGSDDGFSHSGILNQNPISNVYKGGSDDGFAHSGTLNQNPISNIYKGGSDDGFTQSSIVNQNAISNIYKGGNDDGFSHSGILNQNPISNIYKGGSDDGFAHSGIFNQNPISNIYKGGSEDGFAHSGIFNQNPISNIYKGGNDDGFTRAVVTNQNPQAFGITCPAAITVQCITETSCPASINEFLALPGASVAGFCSSNLNYSCTTTLSSGSNCNGIFIRTHTVSDDCGNSVSCTQTITVSDNLAPVLIGVPGNITATCNSIPTAADATATDNCDGSPTISFSEISTQTNNGTCTDQNYIITRTWEAKDNCGNSSSQSQIITVSDNTAPVLIGVPGNTTATCNSIPTAADATAIDNCDGSPTISFSETSTQTNNGTCTDQNYIITRTWEATDNCGKSSSQSQIITVSDNTAPVLTGVPANTTATCNTIPTAADATATDNCDGSPTISFSEISTQTNNGTCTDQTYIITRTWEATDNCGNSSSQSQIITVSDNLPPNVITQSVTVYLNAAGTAIVTAAQVNNNSADNCGSISLSLDKTSFNCNNVGLNTVVLTATDGCGNSSSANASVIVVDNIAPTAICRNITVNLDASGSVTITSAQIDNGSTDACGINTRALSQYTFNAPGEYIVTLTLTDVNGNSSSCNATVRVNKRPTIIVYTGDNDEQYSDHTNLSAELRDQLTNQLLASKSINFVIGSQSKTATTNNLGVASTTLHVYQNVGDYDVTAAFAGDETYASATTTEDYDILKENASVDYTGPEFVSVPCTTCATTTILLSVLVKDTTSGVPPGDVYPGDIRKARIKFIDLNTSANLSGWLSPGLIDPADSTRGLATYLWTVPLPNTGYNTYSIGVIVDADNNGVGNYIGYAQTVINVSRSSLTEFITGGGHIIPTASGGSYASTAGKKVNFGFNVKWNKSVKNLQGKVNVIFRKGTQVYQIKNTSIVSLSINSTNPCSKKAIFISKATLQNVTNPDIAPVPVLGNLTLQLDLEDNGEPGTNNDRIGISLFNNNTLVYSSTIPYNISLPLNGGNIVVHNGAVCQNNTKINNSITTTEIETVPVVNPLAVKLWPNPTANAFTLQVFGNSKEQIEISLFDITGKLLKKINGYDGQSFRFGNEWTSGSYVAVIRQGRQKKVIKLIKQ